MNSTRKPASLAFTLVELLVVLVMLALLASVLAPALGQSRPNAARLQCVNNLKQVGTAFRVWAASHQERYPMQVGSAVGGPLRQLEIAGPAGAVFAWQVFQVMSNELHTPRMVVCPADDRIIASSFSPFFGPGPNPRPFMSNSNISYFVGRDARELNLEMLLAGDRNLGQGGMTNTAPTTPIMNQTVALGTNLPTLAQRNLGWTDRLHTRAGNVTLPDGSVQQLTNFRLREWASRTGDFGSGTAAMVVISPGGNVLLVP